MPAYTFYNGTSGAEKQCQGWISCELFSDYIYYVPSVPGWSYAGPSNSFEILVEGEVNDTVCVSESLWNATLTDGTELCLSLLTLIVDPHFSDVSPKFLPPLAFVHLNVTLDNIADARWRYRCMPVKRQS